MQLATIEGIRTENRVSVSGSNLGKRMAFNREGTPTQMRALYKECGLKGTALSKAVRDAVKAGKDIAWVSFHALTQMAQNGEYIPTMGDVNAKGNKMKLTLEKPIEPKLRGNAATAATALADRDKEVEKLKAELEALKASFAEVVEEAAASTEE
jgi:hypothetical protein